MIPLLATLFLGFAKTPGDVPPQRMTYGVTDRSSKAATDNLSDDDYRIIKTAAQLAQDIYEPETIADKWGGHVHQVSVSGIVQGSGIVHFHKGAKGTVFEAKCVFVFQGSKNPLTNPDELDDWIGNWRLDTKTMQMHDGRSRLVHGGIHDHFERFSDGLSGTNSDKFINVKLFGGRLACSSGDSCNNQQEAAVAGCMDDDGDVCVNCVWIGYSLGAALALFGEMTFGGRTINFGQPRIVAWTPTKGASACANDVTGPLSLRVWDEWDVVTDGPLRGGTNWDGWAAGVYTIFHHASGTDVRLTHHCLGWGDQTIETICRDVSKVDFLGILKYFSVCEKVTALACLDGWQVEPGAVKGGWYADQEINSRGRPTCADEGDGVRIPDAVGLDLLGPPRVSKGIALMPGKVGVGLEYHNRDSPGYGQFLRTTGAEACGTPNKCTDTCEHAKDGRCDDGRPGAATSDCDPDTDCTDCGWSGFGDCQTNEDGDVTDSEYNTRSAEPVRHGYCEDSCTCNQNCAPGEACFWDSNCEWKHGWQQTCTSPASEHNCNNDCRYKDDGDCDDGGPGSEFNWCAFGSDCSDCGTSKERGLPSYDPSCGGCAECTDGRLEARAACTEKCNEAGYCCTTDASGCMKLSCTQGCAVAFVSPTRAACEAKCDALNGPKQCRIAHAPGVNGEMDLCRSSEQCGCAAEDGWGEDCSDDACKKGCEFAEAVSGHYPGDDSRLPPVKYSLIKAGYECASSGGEAWLGNFDAVAACAEACGEQEGCRYFIFGKRGTDREGHCYWEKTTAACEGSGESFYDGTSGYKYSFYEVTRWK